MELVKQSPEDIDLSILSPCLSMLESEQEEATHKLENWIRMAGTRDKLAIYGIYESGKTVGYVEAMPIEKMPRNILGENLIGLLCLMLPHKYRKNLGSFSRLMVDEMRMEFPGRDGLCVISYPLHFQTHSFFEALGFEIIEDTGFEKLAFLSLHEDARKPRFNQELFTVDKIPGYLVIDIFSNPQCPFMTVMEIRIRRALANIGSDRIFDRAHDMTVRENGIKKLTSQR
jgi:hypothetical protein